MFFFQAEDGIRYLVRSRGLGDVYKRQGICGLIAWLFFLIVIVKLHLQSIKAANSPFLRFLALWFASATLALIPAGFVIPTQSDKLEFLFPFVLICTSYLPRLITSLKTEPLYML